MSASTTHQPLNSTLSIARTACAALRLGRNPYDWFWKLASKIGSITIRHACWTIRSRTVGIPGAVGGHPVWGCIPAILDWVDTSLPSGPPLVPQETVLRLVAPPVPGSRRRRQTCLRWLSLLARPATIHRTGICGHRAHETFALDISWPPGIACAEVVVIYRSDEVGRSRHASSLTSPLSAIKVEVRPSDQVVLS
jgi:hypothetical protein